MMKHPRALMVVVLSSGSVAAVAGDADKKAAVIEQLPSGFVRLENIAPDIVVDMRYATTRNFTGDVVPGYLANSCVLARPVAQALARVQVAVRADGYALKVYDCYRPHRAVRAFVRWASGSAGGNATKHYYPRIERQRIIPLGYIAERSSHSLGTAVDLTLVRVKASQVPNADTRTTADPFAKEAGSKQAAKSETSCISAVARSTGDGAGQGVDKTSGQASMDTSIDMGTRWDCFDVMSHTRNGSVSDVAQANRMRLLKAMSAEGFRNYSREWWHFSMSMKGYQRGHDFAVK